MKAKHTPPCAHRFGPWYPVVTRYSRYEARDCLKCGGRELRNIRYAPLPTGQGGRP